MYSISGHDNLHISIEDLDRVHVNCFKDYTMKICIAAADEK